LFLIDILSK